MASIQTLACQALVEFFNHTPIHNIETEMGDICNLVIGNALKEIQLKIDETEMKAKKIINVNLVVNHFLKHSL